MTSQEELKSYFTGVVQDYMDVRSHEKGFDSALTCISYILSHNPKRKAQAEAMNAWRDACWDFAEQYEKDVLDGKRPIPESAEELILELPAFAWPEEEND